MMQNKQLKCHISDMVIDFIFLFRLADFKQTQQGPSTKNVHLPSKNPLLLLQKVNCFKLRNLQDS